jgi:hypothetical protein
MKSDLAAGLTGAIFKSAFPSFDGSMSMVALRSVLISIIARMLSTAAFLPNIGSLSSGQKNELFVVILGALQGHFYAHKNSLQCSVGAVSIDVMADALLTVLNMSDGELLGAAAAVPSAR